MSAGSYQSRLFFCIVFPSWLGQKTEEGTNPYDYLISCSSVSKSSVEKNSPSVISKPSHSFFIVTVPGLLLSQIKMLLIVA